MLASNRFDRQERFEPLGPAGQARLGESAVLLVGCGALGGVLAQTLVRCGVGRLVIVDRDVVEPTNLPRQVLFEDRHAAAGTPKAEAAAEALARIGGPTRVEAVAAHLDGSNLARLAGDADLVLDGTDNLATRYLINDHCVRAGLPWVYGGVVGGAGLVLAVEPGVGACLRCVFPDPPPPGALATCDSAGVILPAVGAVASLQAGLALRRLTRVPGETPEESEPARLLEVDAWRGHVRSVHVERDEACPCCGAREFPFLEAPTLRSAVVLCGRNAVQVQGAGRAPALERVAEGLRGLAEDVRIAGSILRFRVDALCVTLFADGRALIQGTDDPDRARAAYDRYVGS